MCGRFTLRSVDRLIDRLEARNRQEVAQPTLLVPRYNIAPSQEVLTITESRQERAFESMLWGLIPSWSSEPVGFINARAETLEEKPSFSESFKRRRCLILADGFYEWRRTGRSKQPHYFQMKDETPFVFAGLWDRWLNPGAESVPSPRKPAITSCAIVTTTPNELLADIHNRMPVILPAEDCEIWLREDARAEELNALLTPYPADEMKGFPVGQQVNHAKVDHPQLVQPVEVNEIEQGLLF